MKKILVIALLIMCVLITAGCDQSAAVMNEKDIRGNKDDFSMFVKVESGPSWMVVYDRETLCMYAISDCTYNRGTFTLMVNADGTPKLWKEK